MDSLSINSVSIVVSLSTRFGDLKLAFSPSGFSAGLDALRLAATTMTIDDVRVRVACLGDVITSKEAAGRDKECPPLSHPLSAEATEAGRGTMTCTRTSTGNALSALASTRPVTL
jgi:hypothetical protein